MAGTARGRRLRSPEGESTRPTSDRVREAVFNALFSRGQIDGAEVADLFAGSGALGIEALSRGARRCWFVESDRRAADVIDENLGLLGFADRAEVVRRPVEAALDHLPEGLDLVLVDPPYSFDGWTELLGGIGRRLAADGLVVVESDRALEVPATWEKHLERTYGGTVIAFTAPADGTGAHA